MVFCVCLGAVLAVLIGEYCWHRSYLRKIPLRIHVHGTRGKTSTARSIATLLRNNNIRTLAKTTGDAPQMILPDGTTITWRRWGLARVQEHVSFLRLAHRQKVAAVVVECHALGTETIDIAGRMLQATHTIITNCRPDHQETMGETESDVARTLALVLPRGTLLFTSLETGYEALVEEAARRECRVIAVDIAPSLSPLEANERFAAALAGELGLDHSADGARSGGPEWRAIAGTPHRLLDLFSANDVVSSEKLVADAFDGTDTRPLIALLSTRPDRPLRTKAFLEWLAKDERFSGVVPLGWHGFCARSRLPLAKAISIGLWPDPDPEKFLNRLQKLFPGGCNLVGVGNSHGYGERMRKWLDDTGSATSC